ncbi:hypothetical protein ARMGADRAFT_1105444 [Armillaria gallica]|uniref:Uncharacterized protein n=1 Tax=Armillaria gallica TaxID=47427 RepID=A0A2H3DKA6_ARMGA|nr:hypothetical protein ARMGADRAFT_1105444 [Armillaria gallica]
MANMARDLRHAALTRFHLSHRLVLGTVLSIADPSFETSHRHREATSKNDVESGMKDEPTEGNYIGLSAVHEDSSALLSATYSTLRVNHCAFHPNAWPKPDARSNSRSLSIFFDGKKPMTVKIRGLVGFLIFAEVYLYLLVAVGLHTSEFNLVSCQGHFLLQLLLSGIAIPAKVLRLQMILIIERTRISPPLPRMMVPVRGSFIMEVIIPTSSEGKSKRGGPE